MADEKICGNCLRFHPITIPTGKGGSKETVQGHCLAQSIYAKNRPGNPVFPPGAKTADRPYAQHQIVIVRKDQKSPECPDFKKRENKK
jgi:hypothetical protein